MKLRNKIFQLITILLLSSTSIAFAQNNNPQNVNNTPTAENPVNPNSRESETDQKKPGFSLSKIIESVMHNKDSKNKESEKDNSSLMFTSEETSKIKSAFDAFKNDTPFSGNPGEVPIQETVVKEDNAKSYIYLGSILYRSHDNWTVWINDQKISSDENKMTNELYIKKIDSDKAAIVWTMSISKWKILSGKQSEEEAPLNANNQVEFNFTLSFNQTYILSANKVVEGRIFPSAITQQESAGVGALLNKIFK